MFGKWCRERLGFARKVRPIHKPSRLGVESLEVRDVPAFLLPNTVSTGANPAGIAVGDFNRDGRDDMAVVSQSVAGSIGILISNGDGTFQPRTDLPTSSSPFDAAAGDLNGDGYLDLVIAGTAVDVMLGNGDGTFGAATPYIAAGPHSVKVGDFNNDGNLDVGAVNNNSASVWLGNGDGTLQPHMDAPMIGNNINLVIGDFDCDGNLDMASSNTASIGTVNINRGRGDGSFSSTTSYYAFTAPVYLAAGDFNHDGWLDLACPNSYAATSMSILLNNGDGTYAAPHTYGIAQTGYEIEVADFNNDGNEDFAVRGGSFYMVSHGKGDGTFFPSVTFSTPSGRFEAGTHGDFNGDGAVDLAYPGGGGVTVVTNDHADYQNLAGAVTFRVTAPTTTTSGSVLPMSISAVDADGNIATGFRGVAYISSSDPAASTASGYSFNPADAGIPYVFTTADAGTHTFTGAIRLVTGGMQSVNVSAPNMTTGSTSVLVTGQVTKLNVDAPANVNAGESFTIVVSAIDAAGTVADGYSSTVHFTSTDGLAGLPADYTFTAADAGVHAFTVTLKSSGSRFVGVKETGGAIGGGTNVSVTPGAAVNFALAGPGGAIGVARPVNIVAMDAFGNVATGYSGTVHVTSSDPAAVLPADAALANGAAAVNVTLMTVGTQAITATDAAGITGSMASDATPPVAARFEVSGYPATVAGVANTVTVAVRDTIGQVAASYAGTVFFTSSDVQAGLPASYTFTAADAGVHRFTATLKTAGTQSLTVRDAAGLTGTQGGIAVSPAAFASYRLSVPNGMDSKGHILVTAGDAISLTVRATDAFGNTVGGYKGKVKFSSTDAQAGLPTDYSFTTTDAGVHTFVVVLKTATPNGTVWSFSAADASNAASLATITNFEVVNAAASKFLFSTPTNATSGTAYTVKLTVVDAYGNKVKNYFGTVRFGSTAGSLGLPADYTFTPDDAGTHTFTVTTTANGDVTLSIFDAADSTLTASGTIRVKAASGGGGGGGGGSGGGGKKA